MLRPIHSTRKRRPRKREVSRSFRIPPDVDRELDKAAREKRWSKSFLIRDILVSWLVYRNAAKAVEGIPTGDHIDEVFREGGDA